MDPEEDPHGGPEAAKWTEVAKKEAPASRSRAPSQRGKGKTTSPTIETILQNPKDKCIYVSLKKSKSQIQMPLLEGVPKKRRLVLKSAM